MSEKTKIQWCHHTYNPWRGCRKVARECKNCYITTTVPFRTTGQVHGSVRVRAGAATLREPLAWNKAAEQAGERRRVFSLSLGDWLDDENVPIEWLLDLLVMIDATPWLDWLLLTKRPQNWRARIEAAIQIAEPVMMGKLAEWFWGTPRPNVWIGVSAGADQEAAIEIPAKVHFLSCEPMLHHLVKTHAEKFNWIIFGGESGPKARECDVGWIRNGLTFCRAHGIACFIKQLGANVITNGMTGPGEHWPPSTGALVDTGYGYWRKPLVDKKGGDMAEWPEDLRVRELPTIDGK